MITRLRPDRQVVAPRRSRLHLDIKGAVQGVGFRPCVYRLAVELGLSGWVRNSAAGVMVEVEGEEAQLERFQNRLSRELPPRALITGLEAHHRDPQGTEGFEILDSLGDGEAPTIVLPDLATCPDCVAEIFDPVNRRYRYPFTNCTNCGPRYSLIEDLPYDRESTSMRRFTMCATCQDEYDDPADRRFHAQPNACPECGPQLELRDADGRCLADREMALEMVVEALRSGLIVAVKGVGGYHLLVDAAAERAIAELRRRKHREEKPLALIYPSLAEVRRDCQVSALEERLLCGPEAPIVLLDRHTRIGAGRPLAGLIAPGNPTYGVMMPGSPLQYLMLERMGRPLVATSGNLASEPICIDDEEALSRLAGVADLFLMHNRPILRHVDDSIVRVIAGRVMLLRRARGYAPLPIETARPMPPILATGAHLKSAIALTSGKRVFISQHLGDLESAEAVQAFDGVIESFEQLFQTRPVLVVHDAHPGYHSTIRARALALPHLAVQHHHAHVLSCLAENGLEPPALGIAWDGTGHGDDGTIWGGEFLRITEQGYERVAHWRTFALPGGESSIREPRRTAIGLLHEIDQHSRSSWLDLPPWREFGVRELEIINSMLARGLNSPRTSSVGRLFDAVAALIGLRQTARFEGQAAMELEYAIGRIETSDSYPVDIVRRPNGDRSVPLTAVDDGDATPRTMVLDWESMIVEIVNDLASGVPIGFIAAKFHNTLVESLVTVAGLVGEERVCLSGGCFQNRYLLERSIHRLRDEGLQVYWHQRVPPNDGGIALGQAMVAARYLKQH
jgi:hydrogenase maturation protein HypF